MASITVPGLGSGIDVGGVVDQLVAAEGDSRKARLDLRTAEADAKISALGSLQGALAQFQSSAAGLRSANGFLTVSATSSNPQALSATASNIADAGQFSIKVSRLAQAQKLASKAFGDPAAPVGEGTLTFRFGTYDPDANTFTANPEAVGASVTIDGANASLQGIRDAVNSAGLGVRASIVNDGSGQRLVFAARETGLANSLQITVAGDPDGNDTDDAALSQLAYDPTAAEGGGRNLVETVSAQDALLSVDGLAITRQSNTVTGVVDGVTLQLEATIDGVPATLTVARDQDVMAAAVGGFVEGFNTLTTTLGGLTKFDPQTGEAGLFLGDALVRGLQAQLRRILSESVAGLGGPYRSLTEIGITTRADGTLQADTARLSAALADDAEAVARIFGAGGTATDPLVDFVRAGGAAAAGQYPLTVTQLATGGRYTGLPAGSFPLVIDGSNDNLSVQVDGIQSGSIDLTGGTYADGAELALELQTRINGDDRLRAAEASVTVSFSDHRFEIVSDRLGDGSAVIITGQDVGTALSLGIGTGIGSSAGGVDVAGTLGGSEATGFARLLSGTGAAAGLTVEVRGGVLGPRGSVEFSRGLADRLDDLFSAYLGEGGLISGQLDALDGRKADIQADRVALEARLDRLEQRLTARFTALDVLVAELQTTSDFLTTQLASLPEIGGAGSRR
jgi:flagellar hook-associated protein 2